MHRRLTFCVFGMLLGAVVFIVGFVCLEGHAFDSTGNIEVLYREVKRSVKSFRNMSRVVFPFVAYPGVRVCVGVWCVEGLSGIIEGLEWVGGVADVSVGVGSGTYTNGTDVFFPVSSVWRVGDVCGVEAEAVVWMSGAAFTGTPQVAGLWWYWDWAVENRVRECLGVPVRVVTPSAVLLNALRVVQDVFYGYVELGAVCSLLGERGELCVGVGGGCGGCAGRAWVFGGGCSA